MILQITCIYTILYKYWKYLRVRVGFRWTIYSDFKGLLWRLLNRDVSLLCNNIFPPTYHWSIYLFHMRTKAFLAQIYLFFMNSEFFIRGPNDFILDFDGGRIYLKIGRVVTSGFSTKHNTNVLTSVEEMTTWTWNQKVKQSFLTKFALK